MVILENIDIDIDIDTATLQNIDIDKISNRFKFGISNRARWTEEKTLMPGLQLSLPHFISLLLRYYVAVIGMMEKL